MSGSSADVRVSAFAPFRQRAFRWLWLGIVVSGVGAWAQTVGAQWLFIDDPNAATIVSLVQAATSLPSMLLALPGGVIADVFDRRWLLVGVQSYFFTVSLLLAALTWLDLMPPLLLLAFTFAIGVGLALQIPTWQPLITELVPREQIAAATRLDMVSVNVARAVGPAIAGLLIAVWGVPVVFAFNALCVLPLILILLAWRRKLPPVENRERFLPALRTGGRYVRHEPAVRLIMVRLALFVAPATAMWALLAIIANRRLGLASSGYGLLFAALGVGAVLGALTLGGLKQRLSSNALLVASALVYAAALAALMFAPGLPLAMALLVVAGYGWTATASTLVSELQLFLPSWVRARALGVYMMVFMGCQAAFSPLWGLLTQFWGLEPAVLTAAAGVAVSGLLGLWLRVPDNAGLDRTPLAFWADAVLVVEPLPDSGPVQVLVEYRVPPENQGEWLAVMEDLRRSRLRSGAFRWDVYRVGERVDTFVELFAVPSWDEHLRQHEGRLTVEDEQIEKAAAAWASEPPKGMHLLPPESIVPPDPEGG